MMGGRFFVLLQVFNREREGGKKWFKVLKLLQPMEESLPFLPLYLRGVFEFLFVVHKRPLKVWKIGVFFCVPREWREEPSLECMFVSLYRRHLPPINEKNTENPISFFEMQAK